MEKKSLLNFSLSVGNYPLFLNSITALAFQKKSSVVCVANVHMFIEAYRDPSFLRIINTADIVTPDGKPLIWALKIIYGINQERVAGMDFLPELLKKMEFNKISVFFYGGTHSMLNQTEDYLEKNFPNLKVAGLHSPPFDKLEDLHENEIIEKINASSPCIVFVILGCPKQEKWMFSMTSKINTVMIGIGGALPVMVGIQKRAPVWMQKNGLEWLFRLSQEPRRLFRRYSITNSLFLWIFFKEYLKVKFSKKIN